jgi:hypothetical protein
MTVDIEDLQQGLVGTRLPGGEITIEPYESLIADTAFRADAADAEAAHPAWFVVAALRGMGISVDELCALAHQGPGDVLLFGRCDVAQDEPIRPGVTYATTAEVTAVDSRVTKDGSRLDSISIDVVLSHASDALNATSLGSPIGQVTSIYMFKRAKESR